MNPTLIQQAQNLGIEPTYYSIDGTHHTIRDDILMRLINVLSKPTHTSHCFDDIQVLTVGRIGEITIPHEFLSPDSVELWDEHQQTHAIRQPENHHTALPDDGLPCGYYTLRITKANRQHLIKIIVAPPTTYQPDSRPHTGLTIQLYALRSEDNWGIGDLADLAMLCGFCQQQKIDFIGINPLHALFTSHPEYASPYSPSSRIWLNPIYISVPQVARFLHSSKFHLWLQQHSGSLKTLCDNQTVDYKNIWQTKLSALQFLFQEFEYSKDPFAAQQRQQFTQFITQKGNELRGFALFETLDNYFSHENSFGWQNWDAAYQHPNTPEVKAFSAKHEPEIRFHMWLQWLCTLQLAKVNEMAEKSGISLGLYGDLAVGVAQFGADTWLKRNQYCLDLSIGAPPDSFSPIGQNWQLPPYHPTVMRQTACAEFIKIIRGNMKLYSMLRIDHVMALNRLWLITGQNETAQQGAYVRYPQNILFAIIALESHLNQCIVIGEDLGTVPTETFELLKQYQIYSYKVLYFNKNTANFPTHCIATTSTHDLAPLAGFWRGTDLYAMKKLGTLPENRFQAALKQREQEKTHFIQQLKSAQYLPNIFSQPENITPELLNAVHELGARSPAQLYAVQLENMLAMTDNFNLPGIAKGNWVQKYPKTLAEISQDTNIHQQFERINEARMSSPRPYPQPDSHEWETINRLFHAEHDDVFAYLGQHTIDGVGDVIRVLQPNAVAINILARNQKLIAPMQKLDNRGFWVARLPENVADYILSVQLTENGEFIQQEDPYRFGSFLGDTDNWLLGEGKHLRPYERLGAHLREIDGVKGAYFAVWAPNAQRVSVVGEFNAWDGRIHVMRKHHDTGVWEIFIPDVKFNSLYKFELRDSNGHVRVKSDPYAFATELRPTTASVVRGLPEKMPVPEFRAKANAIDAPISIYEVHLGSWKRKANNQWLTYTELADELVDYVVKMGFTHIELLPLSEYPFDGSWGYQATGLYAPTSRFGSPQELQYLVQKAHDAGISVILDWVVGHFPTDEHGLAKFDGTALYEHQDPREGFHQDWNTLIYNFGRNEVRNFLTGNALYWVERFGFDGLRVDAVASMIYRDYSRKDGEWIPNQFGGRENLEAIEFLRETNNILQAQHLDAVGMAEESTTFPNVTKAEGLNFQFKWNMGWMNDTLRYMKEDPINRKYHHHLMTFGMMYQYSENYILPLSHDEVVHGKGSLLGKMNGDCWQKFANLRAYYGFMFGYPGKKLLFMGNEFAQGREWNFNESLDWHLLNESEGGGWHKGIQDYVRELNHIYKNHAPLYQLDQWADGFEWLVADDGNHSVFVFERRDRDGNRMIIISNFTPVVRENYRFGVNMAGKYTEILNSDDLNYKGSGVKLSGSLKTIHTENVASHGRPQSLNLTLPPLATVYLYAENQTSQPKTQSVATTQNQAA